MSQNDTPITGTIAFEDTTANAMLSHEPVPEVIEKAPEMASPTQGESTPDDKNNPQFNPGSKKARQLGETRKKLAKTLIEEAKQNPGAAQALKTAMSSDPQLADYLNKHWSKDVKRISEGEQEHIEVDDVARVTARAEFLAEQIKVQKQDEAIEFAERLSFTDEEADQLVELASKLEGSSVGGIKLDWPQALKKASYAVREDKAKAGAINLPSGASPIFKQNIQKEVEADNLAAIGKKLSGRSADKIKENLKLVDANFKDNVFTVPM